MSLCFGEDDQLAQFAVGPAHLRRVVNQGQQLLQFAVAVAVQDAACLRCQPLQGADFRRQLGAGLGGAGMAEQLAFQFVGLLVGQVVQGMQQLFILQRGRHWQSVGAGVVGVQAGLQALPAPLQRVIECRRRGGQSPLQNRQGETDGAAPPAMLDLLGAVKLPAHIVGHALVKLAFGIGELIVDGVGAALGEERVAIEFEQAFFGHAAHEVADVVGRRVGVGGTGEAVFVQQLHEQLEIVGFAIVRRGRHQQQVAGDAAEQPAQLIAFGFVGALAGVGCRHFVRFIADDQVPARFAQLRQQIGAAADLVQADNQALSFGEGLVAAGDQVAVEDGEIELEFVAQFVLPLLAEAAGRADQAAFDIAAQAHLADEQAGHDGFASAGVVRQQVAQGLARQHVLVDGDDLMRQRVNHRRVQRRHGVEDMAKLQAGGFLRQAEVRAVAVKCPVGLRIRHIVHRVGATHWVARRPHCWSRLPACGRATGSPLPFRP